LRFTDWSRRVVIFDSIGLCSERSLQAAMRKLAKVESAYQKREWRSIGCLTTL
jgi:hypothetical protein